MPANEIVTTRQRLKGTNRRPGPVGFLASVRLGISLLIALVAVSILGMLVTQYNVAGFDRYYAGLDDFRRTVYGALGFFDIYGTWYFNALIVLLAINIILASIDRFPRTWRLIRRPNLTPTADWIRSRAASFEIETEKFPDIARSLKKLGWRNVVSSDSDDCRTFFAERGAWNRLGAYAVHVALLTVLAGGFVSSQCSFSGQMPITVGENSGRISELVLNRDGSAMRYRQLPFTVKCVDLRQLLIDPKGPLESSNSIDWTTVVEISDESGTRTAEIGLNRPYDYRGYRFFHSTFLPIGKARTVSVAVEGADGTVETVQMERGATATLADGSTLRFADFRADLDLMRDRANENSVDYRNPAAVLEAVAPDGRRRTVFAVRDNQPGERRGVSEFAGRSFRLKSFEKVSDRHILLVRYDPGTRLIYAGFVLLAASLLAVFLFSHSRIWIRVDALGPGRFRIVGGGDTNRNEFSFRDRFGRLNSEIGS